MHNKNGINEYETYLQEAKIFNGVNNQDLAKLVTCEKEFLWNEKETTFKYYVFKIFLPELIRLEFSEYN